MIRCIFLVLILAGMLTGGCGEQPAPVQNAGAKTIILYSELDNKFTENLVDAFNREQMDKLPEGLNGANAVRIYVPKDLKIPQEQGENQFYLLNKTRKEMTEIWEKPYIGGLELVYP